MRKFLFFMAALFIFQTAQLYAIKSRKQTHESFQDFERGKAVNVSILKEGHLSPAPLTRSLLKSGDPFIWDVVRDSKGNLYVGTGNEGRVYRVSADGDSTLYFDAQELQIFALVIDQQDRLFAATSPEGKVYQLTGENESSLYFEPNEKYIWDMVTDDQDNLYVATGDSARIYKISSNGEATVYYTSDQTHVRCLNIGSDQTLYAGTSGSGYVIKFEKNQDAYVVFDTQMEEVHDIVTNGQEMYVAAFGEISRRAATMRKSTRNGRDEESDTESMEITLSPQSILPPAALVPAQTQTSLFRIDPLGQAVDIWTMGKESIQSLMVDEKGEIWVGAGENTGKLYQIDRDGELSLILTADESQITHIMASDQGTVYMATSNMARLYKVGPMLAKQAHFESESIDAGELSQWGNLAFSGKNTSNNAHFFTRSGNTEQPGKMWSDWQPVQKVQDVYRIQSPASRFLQWKCQFDIPDKGVPVISEVAVSYIQRNLPPQISTIIVHSPDQTYNLSDIVDQETAWAPVKQRGGLLHPKSLPSPMTKKGYRSVDWLFNDPNSDAIQFKIQYQFANTRDWHLLADHYPLNVYTWDSSQMPDGEYRLRITACDHLSNDPEQALTHSKVSDIFIIDNSGPALMNFDVSEEVVTFNLLDDWNSIENAAISYNSTGWMTIFPQDKIYDSKQEFFRVDIPDSLAGKVNFIAIKAKDEFGNINVVQKTAQGK
jgi:sugar lactone lactonase YvrE